MKFLFTLPLLGSNVQKMRIKGVITKERCFDIQTNFPYQFHKKCMENSKENMHFCTRASRVKYPSFVSVLAYLYQSLRTAILNTEQTLGTRSSLRSKWTEHANTYWVRQGIATLGCFSLLSSVCFGYLRTRLGLREQVFTGTHCDAR